MSSVKYFPLVASIVVVIALIFSFDDITIFLQSFFGIPQLAAMGATMIFFTIPLMAIFGLSTTFKKLSLILLFGMVGILMILLFL